MGRGNPNPPNKRLSTAGPGRPKGSKNKLTRERLELEIRRLALSNILDAFENMHGNRKKFTLRELRSMPEDFQRCIASVKVRTENLTAGDDAQDTTIEIKLWDKMEALAMYAKHFGWATDRLAITVDVSDRVARLEAARQRIGLPESSAPTISDIIDVAAIKKDSE